jgi:dTDP-4-dehydrorhamnose reductase
MQNLSNLANKINTELFNYIIRYIKQVNGRLIQISTDYVFSSEQGNYFEEDLRESINVYGKSKKEAEDILFDSGIEYRLIFNLFPFINYIYNIIYLIIFHCPMNWQTKYLI